MHPCVDKPGLHTVNAPKYTHVMDTRLLHLNYFCLYMFTLFWEKVAAIPIYIVIFLYKKSLYYKIIKKIHILKNTQGHISA